MRRLPYMLMTVLVLLLAGCGSNAASTPTGGGGSTPVPIELPSVSVGQLPYTSGPVVTVANGSLSAWEKTVDLGKAAATVGMSVGDSASCLATNNYAGCKLKATSSRHMCEQMNAAIYLAQGLGNVDEKRCLIESLVGDGSAVTVDFRDEQMHRIDVTGLAVGGETIFDALNIKVVVSNEKVTEIEYAACTKGTQTAYFKEKIAASGSQTTATIVAKDVESSRSATFEVSGPVTFDASVNRYFWTGDKAMTYSHDDANVAKGTSTITQAAAFLTFDDYNEGSQGANTHKVRIYGRSDFLDGNSTDRKKNPLTYDLSKIGIGHGDSEMITDDFFDGASSVLSAEEGWDGDTTLASSANGTAVDYDVSANDPSPAPSTISVAFTSAENVGCAGTAEQTLAATSATVAACEKYASDVYYIECESLAKNGPGASGLKVGTATLTNVDTAGTTSIAEGASAVSIGSATDITISIPTTDDNGTALAYNPSSVTITSVTLEKPGNTNTPISIYFTFPSSTSILVHLGTSASDDSVVLEAGQQYRLRVKGADGLGASKVLQDLNGTKTIATGATYDFEVAW